MENGSGEELARYLSGLLENREIEAISLVGSNELPTFEKYDEYIPADLLRYSYSCDRLNVEETRKRIFDIYNEY